MQFKEGDVVHYADGKGVGIVGGPYYRPGYLDAIGLVAWRAITPDGYWLMPKGGGAVTSACHAPKAEADKWLADFVAWRLMQ